MTQTLRLRGFAEHVVQPLTVVARANLIEEMMCQFSKRLTPAQCGVITGIACSTNPLFLTILLDELVSSTTTHSKLDGRIAALCSAASIPELLHMILARLEGTFDVAAAGPHLLSGTFPPGMTPVARIFQIIGVWCFAACLSAALSKLGNRILFMYDQVRMSVCSSHSNAILLRPVLSPRMCQLWLC